MMQLVVCSRMAAKGKAISFNTISGTCLGAVADMYKLLRCHIAASSSTENDDWESNQAAQTFTLDKNTFERAKTSL